MNIKTNSSEVLKARKTIVELLLSDHPQDCLICERNGNCELQKLAQCFSSFAHRLQPIDELNGTEIAVNADYHIYHPDTSTIEIKEVE